MKNNKPDALLVLAVIFGLGLLISTLTHGDNDQDTLADQSAAQYSATYVDR